MAVEIFPEQYPSTSYASEVKECHQRITPASAYTLSSRIDSLPPEIHLKILMLLSRPDVDNCSLVCQRWKNTVTLNAHLLARHQIYSMRISERKGDFMLTIRTTEDFEKRWEFPKTVANAHPRKRILSTNEGIPMKQRKLSEIEQKNAQIFFAAHGSTLISSLIHELLQTEDQTNYKAKLHTPTDAFFRRFARCFQLADVKQLFFDEVRLTDGFVDFLDFLTQENTTFVCDELRLDFCKLKYITPSSFAKLFKIIRFSSCSMAYIRDNVGHILPSNEVSEALKTCQRLDLSNITDDVCFSEEYINSYMGNPTPMKTLRLDNCEITNIWLMSLVERWKTSAVSFSNICLNSGLISVMDLKKSLSRVTSSCSKEQLFLIEHSVEPKRSLKVWTDQQGVHLVEMCCSASQ
ncbi:hypothetical protein AB6A40_003758 [Gnathostoma spinigerum]|uniref:F-box domain-containing protein n=1 Tax=Gnathostoma spinigerum TaxID=75299 RepID=A0ABD6EG04_9BILA